MTDEPTYPGWLGDEKRADAELAAREQGEMTELERKTRGLIALAACAGNAAQASRHLKRTESPVQASATTLARWKEELPDVYARVADDHGTRLEAALVVDHREAAMAAMGVVDEAIARVKSNLKRTTAAEASKIALDMSKVVAQSTKDLLLLTGRPTDIKDDRSAPEILAALDKRFPNLFAALAAADRREGERIVDVEPVEDEDLFELEPPPQEPAPDEDSQ